MTSALQIGAGPQAPLPWGAEIIAEFAIICINLAGPEGW
jgi:hypothetical protein